jgi:hypothetical protein
MLIVAILLVVVILILSSVLIMISKKVIEITKKTNKAIILILAIVGTIFSNTLQAQASVISDSVAKAPADFYGGMSYNSFWTLSTVMMLELIIIFILVLFIRGLWKVVIPLDVTSVHNNQLFLKLIKNHGYWVLGRKLDKQFFTKAAPKLKKKQIFY